MFEPASPPFVPHHIVIRGAADPWEREGALRLRREVFCEEQGLLTDDDRDAYDEAAHTIVAVTLVMGISEAVVGTVRIHQTAPRRWVGSRLAIPPEYRGVWGLGAGLVHRAVGTALARGCDLFLATVQRQNVPFFRRLRWQSLEQVEVCGYPHMLMRADLDAYEPCFEGSGGVPLTVRRAS
ncbi:MAG TPA: MSMEG_0567/Sll0786 family nitrogen starvation N-acetyltransferase [Candidatus Acidoferrum sp.]|nr:MSMEG_0567/Sll0786 family nitrogen starvation N-acetyltransferase [Candidatus Acidoferrum sp.]